jgi:hypothetical protein
MSWIVEAPNNNPSAFVLISSTVFQIDGYRVVLRALVRRGWLQRYSMRVRWSWAMPCSGQGCLGSRGHRTHRSDAVAR